VSLPTQQGNAASAVSPVAVAQVSVLHVQEVLSLQLPVNARGIDGSAKPLGDWRQNSSFLYRGKAGKHQRQ
jgi:hypothetical protein